MTELEDSRSATLAALTGTARGAIPALEFAARSILESQALTGTVASVVQERALDHHFRGLFQYAAIRVGGEHASALLARLEAEAEGVLREPVHASISPQAKLYARLREQLGERAQERPPADSPIWWRPAHAGHRAGLTALRRQLSAELAEVAELSFARRLRPSEVAHVLRLELPQVESARCALPARRPRSCSAAARRAATTRSKARCWRRSRSTPAASRPLRAASGLPCSRPAR